MSNFKAKMHQIWFRLGLHPKPCWGALKRSLDPLTGFKWPTSKGGEGKDAVEEGKVSALLLSADLRRCPVLTKFGRQDRAWL